MTRDAPVRAGRDGGLGTALAVPAVGPAEPRVRRRRRHRRPRCAAPTSPSPSSSRRPASGSAGDGAGGSGRPAAARAPASTGSGCGSGSTRRRATARSRRPWRRAARQAARDEGAAGPALLRLLGRPGPADRRRRPGQDQDLDAAGGDGLRLHPRDASRRFARHGAAVDMVQVGNEITAGMLWPLGQIYATDAADCAGFVTLLKAGIAGARAARVRAPAAARDGARRPRRRQRRRPLVLRPHARARRRVRRDRAVVLPVLARPARDLQANLIDTGRARTASRLVVVETAYPWTLENGDELENHIDSPGAARRATAGRPPRAGQAAYFAALRDVFARCRTASAAASSTGSRSGCPASAGRPARATRTTTSRCSTSGAARCPGSTSRTPPGGARASASGAGRRCGPGRPGSTRRPGGRRRRPRCGEGDVELAVPRQEWVALSQVSPRFG